MNSENDLQNIVNATRLSFHNNVLKMNFPLNLSSFFSGEKALEINKLMIIKTQNGSIIRSPIGGGLIVNINLDDDLQLSKEMLCAEICQYFDEVLIIKEEDDTLCRKTKQQKSMPIENDTEIQQKFLLFQRNINLLNKLAGEPENSHIRIKKKI